MSIWNVEMWCAITVSSTPSEEVSWSVTQAQLRDDHEHNFDCDVSRAPVSGAARCSTHRCHYVQYVVYEIFGKGNMYRSS